MGNSKVILDNAKQELRRGTLILTVLFQLDEPQYGYSLAQELEGKGIEIDQSTLYPLLRRIEKQALIVGEWVVGENRPRKYYNITPLGKEVRDVLFDEWKKVNTALNAMAIKGGK